MKVSVSVCTTVLVLCLCCVVCEEMTVEQQLQRHIVSRQNVKTTLVTGSIEMTKMIAVHFIPVAIVGLNEENQVFSFSGILITGWVDPRAAWDPALFNNTHAVTIKSNLLWTPELTAVNNVVAISRTVKDEAFVFSNGYINVFYADPYQTSCQIDTNFFPFDEQVCEVLLFPSGMYQFYAERSKVKTPEYFLKSNEWRLVSVTLHNRTYSQPFFDRVARIKTVAIQFRLKRYSAFYVMSILSPIGVLSLMNACVFLLPVESGEKMSYLVSILISYAMFLNFVYSTMPKSHSLSRLTIYLMLVVSQSCLSIVSTIYLLNVYHHQTKCRLARSKVEPSGADRKCKTCEISVRQTDKKMAVVFFTIAFLSLLVFVKF